jgi:uncharacterized protein YoxC
MPNVLINFKPKRNLYPGCGKYHRELKGAITMDDNKVAVLLEDLLTKFRTFGEGQDDLRNRMERLEYKVDGLTEDMDIVKPSVKGLIEDMDFVKPTLSKIVNRLDNIEGEIIKLNPESRAILKQVK